MCGELPEVQICSTGAAQITEEVFDDFWFEDLQADLAADREFCVDRGRQFNDEGSQGIKKKSEAAGWSQPNKRYVRM